MSDTPAENPSSRPGAPSSIWRNWLTLAGAVLTGSAVFAFIFLFLMDQFGGHSNAYVGVLCYMVAPGFGFAGLMLMLLGGWWQRRARRRRPDAPAPRLAIDLSRPRDRKLAVWFGVGTMTFLLLTSLGSYQTYHFTESNQFCGMVCHDIMAPEFIAHQKGNHARVACVECHIGEGATWFVKAKVNGAHQVYAALRDSYSRPIPTPISNLRPARDTCEQCHWPEKFVGNIDRTYQRYLADEESTPFAVRLLLHVGGGSEPHGPVGGIHWHTSPDHTVEYYATDPQRLTIPWVRVTNAKGEVTVFRKEDFTEEPPSHAIRRMDCLDCHNRPAHNFMAPNDAVDEALTYERLDRSLPSIKRTAVDLLTAEYTSHEEAATAIAAGLKEAYADRAGPAVDAAVATVTEIYQTNFFPQMKANWSAYPVHQGHKDSPGCFRCHDGSHKAVDNPQRTIAASDCKACHTITAQGTGAELAEFSLTGLPFKHPDGEPPEGLLCSDCHNGKMQ